MYGWYQQSHRPTGIEHCTYCHFTSEQEKDVIVSAASCLTVYRLKKDLKFTEKNEKREETTVHKNKLQEIGSWQLFGNIISLKHIKLSGTNRNALLLSFKEAKLSIVEFDISTHDIRTSSLHYFEDSLSEVQDGMFQRITQPKVSTEPEGRCAAMQLTSTVVAIIPFRINDSILSNDDDLSDANTGKKSNALTSFTINLHNVDARLQRIIDFKFLHGYYEPTLLILFESLRTWSGRIAVRQDTCNIVAISLNLAEQLYPVIWSLNGLPFDCKYAYAVPKPIGGILIFAVNALLYLNQSVPPYGTSVNSLTENSTSFPLKPQEGVCITFDGSLATFLSPERLVVSLKTGELYVLTLLVDSMRSVRNFHFDKAASCVVPSCITNMDGEFLFLGSRLGNSLLLKYTKADALTPAKVIAEQEIEEPSSKRKRINTAADWIGNDDETDMYGKDTVTSEPLSLYQFEVCDNIVNIGPCGSAELGEPAFLSEEFINQRESDLELVLLSGHGKNGALSILQSTIKPQIVTTFELPGCIDMWTVCSASKSKKNANMDPTQHGFLILSREESTLILETGKEIMEIEESGYNTRQTTVHVGNIGGSKQLILQVCENGVWLLDGVELLQHISLDFDTPIVQCSICDPYAVLLTEDGQIILLTLKENNNEVKLEFCNPSISQIPAVSTLSTYCDKSDLFVTSFDKDNTHLPAADTNNKSDDDLYEKKEANRQEKQSVNTTVTSMMGKDFTVDEEDELLYGDSNMTSNSVFNVSDSDNNKTTAQESTKDKKAESDCSSIKQTSEKTYWVVLVRENRNLEIYSMPDFSLSFVVKNFTVGHKLLINSVSFHNYSESEKSSTSDSRNTNSPEILELLLIGLGHNALCPYLLARLEDEILVYQVFSYPTEKSSKSKPLQIRFKKVNHNMMIRRSPNLKSKEGINTKKTNHLRPFDNTGGYGGVFLCGPYPYWIFVTPRSVFRCHPMTVDGAVTCFVPFHNVNCPHGFLYFNSKGELRICMLPTHMKYDSVWPVRKVSLKCTPHFLTYSIEHKVYALVTSVSEPCTRLPYLTGENEREFDVLEKEERFVYPQIVKYSVQLISPIGWELVPNARLDMDEFEHVTCMKNVWLNPGSETSTRQNFVVVGTCNVMGEEMSSRGKIIILEMIEVVPEPGQPLTKNKLKQIYSEEQKGPVTALCGVEGNLLAAIGQKVFIWRFDENQSLRGLAFVDTNTYIHHAFNFRSFAVIADIQRSITLLRYQEEFKTLSVTSRDVRPLEVYTADLLVDGNTVGFLTSDHKKNLILFIYDPQARESQGGTRLTRRADMHIGSHVNCMWRVAACPVDKSTGLSNENYMGAHITMMATLDGSINCVLPVAEKIYRRLLMLQNLMVVNLQHTAGLNPKGFRHVKTNQKNLINPMKNMLDGDLLLQFNKLSFYEKHELAKKIGTTSDQVCVFPTV